MLGSIIVCVILAGVVFLIVHSMVKKKKRTGSAIGCDCGNTGCSACHGSCSGGCASCGNHTAGNRLS